MSGRLEQGRHFDDNNDSNMLLLGMDWNIVRVNEYDNGDDNPGFLGFVVPTYGCHVIDELPPLVAIDLPLVSWPLLQRQEVPQHTASRTQVATVKFR
jgi:hypothetical protein